MKLIPVVKSRVTNTLKMLTYSVNVGSKGKISMEIKET